MSKLWQKDYSLNKEIEKFTVGNDFLIDKNLVKYDVYGSIAHAIMLEKIGILSKNELQKLKKALIEIMELHQKNQFEIKLEDEDVHTSIENYLIKKLGDLGKKIHTARSRNDQVLVDIRLYSKEKLLEVQKLTLELASVLVNAAEKYKDIPMPGYTHSRKAMPSSVGLYFGSFAESLIDDSGLLEEAYNLNNQSPLGSGAGYGLSLNVDRQLVADLLGFEKVQNNVLYVQNSRGKFESVTIFALSNVMNDLARLSNDLILFSMDGFGFFKLPDEFCTGSSIMPQKKNPDVFELTRAKAAKVDSNLYLVKSIISKLQSGYNRDLQLTKEPLMESFEIALSALNIFKIVIEKIQVNKDKCISACTPDLFATEHAYELVKKGIPFRDAYKQTAKNINKLPKINPIKNIQSKKHIGATGNLGLEKIKEKIKLLQKKIDTEIEKFSSKAKSLVNKND
ncbi:argininosuccinate lyase [Candidatus Woesearchaeota archaeon]|nr:argininosuccinate lyase [Candidatus Woesearchaeota archaeon]